MAKKDHHQNGHGCSVCPQWDRGVNRCRLGKMLPTTLKGAAEAVKWFGMAYLCPYTKTASIRKIKKLLDKS